MIPADDQKHLPEDENTPEKRAEKIWEFFGKKDNGKWKWIKSCSPVTVGCLSFAFICFLFCCSTDKISEGEFIQGVMDNKDILRLIQYDEPQKIKDKLKEKKQ